VTSRAPAIAGFLGAGALLLAISFFADRRPRGPAPELPPIRMLAPRSGDEVANPVTVRFTTPAPLRLSTNGWTAGDLHLHVLIDGVELMSSAVAIQSQSDTFTWRLPPLERGGHRIYLTWAARHHANLAGATDTISITVR
jgi:hypothetical protein